MTRSSSSSSSNHHHHHNDDNHNYNNNLQGKLEMEVAKLLYIVVEDDFGGDEERKGNEELTFRYTRHVLQSTLQLMGCKARHAFKISQRVFEIMRTECSGNSSAAKGMIRTGMDFLKVNPTEENISIINRESDKEGGSMENEGKTRSKPFESYKKRTTVVVKRKRFVDVVCDALAEYKYVGPNQRADLVLACRIRERKESVTVLLCGTSGCGKSTLSALLASRLGITTVISTDSIRHMMRSFVEEKQNPLLWSSTYHAGEYLDPVAVSEAKAKRKAKKQGSVSPQSHLKGGPFDGSTTLVQPPKEGSGSDSSTVDLISPKQMAIEGFKAQSEMVIDSLDRLITAWEERKESVVVEGVHLSLNFVMGLMKKHPSIIPFMIYITNEDKHMERFAVRAKYMTLDPAKNKYVKYIRNIRTIQEYLCNRADKHLVPKVNNTNVDKSVAAIHATVFSCLRRREANELLYDPITNTVSVVDEEYRNQCVANSLSSKGMFQVIQRQGSSRNLMALLNDDGSVARAWPVHFVDADGKPIVGNPGEDGIRMYEPLQIGKAEPVNLQFGSFGISAWSTDLGCTSRASSVDESRGELTDNGSRYHSSCCSSPKVSDGPAKELKEEQSVYGSDEEVDDTLEVDSDEDLSDDAKEHMHEEMEGSVDERSTKSDEEYDDLAMQDIQENGYFTDDEFDPNNHLDIITNNHGEKYSRNLDRFLRSKSELGPHSMHPNPNPGLIKERCGSFKVKRRSHSISCFGKDGPLSPTLVSVTTTLSPDHP